jgi:hypothetical protein
MDKPFQGTPRAPRTPSEEGELEGRARRLRDVMPERQLCVRIDSQRYAMLEDLAMRHGVAPTTMARMLVHRGLRQEEDLWE